MRILLKYMDAEAIVRSTVWAFFKGRRIEKFFAFITVYNHEAKKREVFSLLKINKGTLKGN